MRAGDADEVCDEGAGRLAALRALAGRTLGGVSYGGKGDASGSYSGWVAASRREGNRVTDGTAEAAAGEGRVS